MLSFETYVQFKLLDFTFCRVSIKPQNDQTAILLALCQSGSHTYWQEARGQNGTEDQDEPGARRAGCDCRKSAGTGQWGSHPSVTSGPWGRPPPLDWRSTRSFSLSTTRCPDWAVLRQVSTLAPVWLSPLRKWRRPALPEDAEVTGHRCRHIILLPSRPGRRCITSGKRQVSGSSFALLMLLTNISLDDMKLLADELV